MLPPQLENERESNMVDVRGADGLLKQGKIVDCADGGLAIDYGCEGQGNTQFVPFGEIYLYRRRCFSKVDASHVTDENEVPVEVLVYRGASEAWTWYPSRLIMGDFSSSTKFALVRAQLSDGEKVLVCRIDRIRLPRTEVQLQSAQLIKTQVRLPEHYCRGGASCQEVVDALNGTIDRLKCHTETIAWAIRMDDKSLVYVKTGNGIPKSQRDRGATIAGGKLRELLEIATTACNTATTTRKRKRKVSKTVWKLPASLEAMPEPSSTSPYRIQLLPKHILAGIFQHLDGQEQTRLRPVSVSWNAILTSPCVTRVLLRSFHRGSQDWKSVASLHHCWTPHTRIIINAGEYAHMTVQSASLSGGRLFRALVEKGRHSSVQTVVLVDDRWCSGRLQDFIADLDGMTAVCDTLVLRNMKMVWVEDFGWWVRVHVVRGQTGKTQRITIQDFWSRMDDSLPSLEDSQLQALSAWINTGGIRIGELVAQVLNKSQSADPRDIVNYRNHHWTPDNLTEVELRKLTKFTLHSLIVRNERREPLYITVSF